MKPEPSSIPAPPAAAHNDKNKPAAPSPILKPNPGPSQSSSPNPGEKPARLPTSARSRRLPQLLIVMLVIYGLWLGWLAYVALINVRAGNQ